MKAKQIFVEIIFLILILNFFYEGIYKVAHFRQYAFWLHHAPLIEPVAGILQYMIPVGEIALSLALIIPGLRVKAISVTIVSLILFVLWIMSVYLFTHRLFWPYHALWHKPTWMQKLMIVMGLSWLGFLAMALTQETSNASNIKNSLRKMPANAH